MKSTTHFISTRLRASVAVFAWTLGVLVVLAMRDVAAAVPAYRPTSASEIVLRVGASTGEAQLTKLRELTTKVPDDAGALANYVRALIVIGTRTGNERYFGFAEQAINTAPEHARTTNALLLAQLLQHRHDFKAAETVFGEILEHNPHDYEARLMRAQVRLHLHNPDNALQDCAQLVLKVDLLTSTTCTAQARVAMSTDLVVTERAYAVVTSLLQLDAPKPARSWAAGVAAEFAARLGHVERATDWYRAAYEWDRDSHFARIAYADWLLAHGNNEVAFEVASTGASIADNVRAVLAKGSATSGPARQLQLAWREAEARGERTHLRDRARFELFVLEDSARAHGSALDNFRDHRESEDALLLAQTAAARQDVEAFDLIKRWQWERRYADRRIDSYVAASQ